MTTLAVPPFTGPSATSEPRFPAVTANLLPEEIIIRRAAGKARRVAFISVAAAVVLMAAITGGAKLRTAAANSDLTSAQHQAQVLTNEQNKYSSLVQAKQRTQEIQGQLAGLMSTDLNWSKYYNSIKAVAPHGLSVTSLGGTLTPTTPAAASTTQPSLFSTPGQTQVGTLTISGNAGNKTEIAAFVDALGGVKGVADVYPSGITTTGNGASGVTFNLTCVITSTALGGRFTPAVSTTDSPSTSSSSTGGTR
jgi:Tfp pilus assembly protein PilN